jgi:hypothetical protein
LLGETGRFRPSVRKETDPTNLPLAVYTFAHSIEFTSSATPKGIFRETKFALGWFSPAHSDHCLLAWFWREASQCARERE